MNNIDPITQEPIPEKYKVQLHRPTQNKPVYRNARSLTAYVQQQISNGKYFPVNSVNRKVLSYKTIQNAEGKALQAVGTNNNLYKNSPLSSSLNFKNVGNNKKNTLKTKASNIIDKGLEMIKKSLKNKKLNMNSKQALKNATSALKNAKNVLKGKNNNK